MLAVRKMLADVSIFSVEEVEVPEPVPGEARIAVFGAGMCGTDLHLLHGEYPSRPPVTIGHEVAGVVDAVGAEKDRGWVGVRVAPETAVTCGACEWCRIGKPMLCAERLSIGSGVDGGFARYVVVPVRSLHRLPDSVPDHAAALSEPLSCVCNALADPSVVNPGDRVIVIGAGAVGILAAQVARAAGGIVTLVGTDADERRMAVATSLGIDCRSVDDGAGRGALEAEGAARGIHVAVECAGAESAVQWGMALVRPRGRYVQMGLLSGPAVIQLNDLVTREVTVTTGFGSSPAGWRRAMRLFASGAVDAVPLVTDVLPLRQWNVALEHMRDRDGIKTVLDPRLS